MKNPITYKRLLAGLVAVSIVIAGCGQTEMAVEEGEFYNTVAIPVNQLFGANGLAPVSLAQERFVRVGFMWDAEEGCVLEGRIFFADGSISEWLPLRARWTEGVAHTGHIDVPTASSEPVGFQLRHVSGPAPLFVMAEGIAKIGEVLEPTTIQNQDGLKTMGQALAPSSLVHPRSDWGARAPACSSGSHSPSKITVHHTATPLPDSVSPTSRLRQIQNYHIDSRGWCDIGYHFLVDWNGELWQGRNETVIGAHVANHNTNNVGISFMGTYNSISPTSAQLDNVGTLMGWLHDRYGIPLSRTYIKGHREYRGNSPGDCPGDRVYSALQDMIDIAAGGGSGGGTGGDPGQQPSGNGRLIGVVFEDTGAGTADMSHRLEGATVTLSNGASTTASGSDALWSFDLPAGTYTVTASYAGYSSASRTCTVSAGQDTWCSIGLVKEQVPTGIIQGVVFEDVGLGTSDMSNRLGGATVTLSSGQSTIARASDAYWSFEIPAGTYTVTASLTGYQSASRTCTVYADGQTWCSIGLVPDGGRDVGGTGGDTGGGTGGDTGGGTGGDTGGGTSGGDQSGTGGSGAADEDGMGWIYGKVVNVDTLGYPPDYSAAQGIAGARINIDDRVVAVTDENGHFEALVVAGITALRVKADGYFDAGQVCEVTVGGRVECNVDMIPLIDSQGDSNQADQSGQPGQYGCSTTSSGGSLLGLLLLGLCSLRRRR